MKTKFRSTTCGNVFFATTRVISIKMCQYELEMINDGPLSAKVVNNRFDRMVSHDRFEKPLFTRQSTSGNR